MIALKVPCAKQHIAHQLDSCQYSKHQLTHNTVSQLHAIATNIAMQRDCNIAHGLRYYSHNQHTHSQSSSLSDELVSSSFSDRESTVTGDAPGAWAGDAPVDAKSAPTGSPLLSKKQLHVRSDSPVDR